MPMYVKGVAELVTALGEAPKEIRLALRPAITTATDIIAQQVKANASFSSYIPGAVHEAVSFAASGGGGKITVAERDYPHAGEVRVFEGNGVSPTPFRHPVYGNREVWTGKNAVTHPFAGPAVREKESEATAVIAAAVEGVISSLGL